MILAIDIGNTRTKFGLFSQEELIRVHVAETEEVEEALAEFLRDHGTVPELSVGWTSVSHVQQVSDWAIWKEKKLQPKFVRIDHHSTWPIQNGYATPKTLGTDRIVGVIGARSIQRTGPILLIDAGTALTFEALDAEDVYVGGAISPGIRMRFQALHTFTAKLPLIDPVPAPNLIGNSTQSCMQSGVMNGILAEVNDVIRQYRSHFGPDLSVFLTGGDMGYFEKLGKNINFADPNLILRGIHFILTHQ